MEVIQGDQALLGDLPRDGQRHALVLERFDHFEEVHSHDLKHHYEMFSIRTEVNERVEQLHTGTAIRVRVSVLLPFFPLVVDLGGVLPLLLLPVRRHLVENLNLVVSCLEIVLRRFLDFQRNKRIILEIFGQPNC